MIFPSVVAVIPAAGVGSRMQTDRPKQYLTLSGKTILEHTLDTLLDMAVIESIVIAISPDDTYFYSLPIANHPKIKVVEGGTERATSVLNAVKTLPCDSWALVHDAARPCVTQDDINALLQVIHNATVAGGILATPVRDTMKRSAIDRCEVNHNASLTMPCISHTENRDNLWHALTPQLFPSGLLTEALTGALSDGALITDEASAIEWLGHRVALFDSNPANIKITHPADLPLAEFYIKQTHKVNE